MDFKIGDHVRAKSKLNYVRFEGTVSELMADGRIKIDTAIGAYVISLMLFDIERV